jgi:pyridoxine kinase
MARVLAISSHVVRGHVGLAANVAALQALGHEVWALPTVLLASRPGLGRLVKRELPPSDLAAMLDALEQDGCWPSVDAVLTGYFASPAAVAAAARAIDRIRQANHDVLVLVDPILGDAGRLYIEAETAQGIRDELLPLATAATPNRFELEWLAGRALPDRASIEAAARGLGPVVVVVTSAQEDADSISTLLVTPEHCLQRDTARYAGMPNGPGDLFAGLMAGNLLGAPTPQAALQASLTVLDRVLARSVGMPVLNLAALLEAIR